MQCSRISIVPWYNTTYIIQTYITYYGKHVHIIQLKAKIEWQTAVCDQSITIDIVWFIVQPAVFSEWLLFLFIIVVCCFCRCRAKKNKQNELVKKWSMDSKLQLINSRGSHDPSSVRGFTASVVTALLATLDRYVIRHSSTTLLISIQQSAVLRTTR